MKKVIKFIFLLVISLSVVACGNKGTSNDTQQSGTTNKEENSVTEEPTPTPSKEPPKTEEIPLLDVELCAEYAIEKLKSVLKNPNSLAINGMYGVEGDGGYIIAIDYSAENGFGGTNRDNFFLHVSIINNGYSVKTYGSGSFVGEDNQKYTAQFFAKYKKAGYFFFDTKTMLVETFVEGEPENTEPVELKGTLQGVNKSFEGAWDFRVGNNPYLKLVYFADDVDLTWYEKHSYEITISAIEKDGKYYDAIIVEDPILDANHEERFERFSYDDRKFYVEYASELFTKMTKDEILTVLSGNTFKMRNNYGGDKNGLHTITFYKDGSLDANYTYDGKQYTMYKSWKIKDGAVVLKQETFKNSFGEKVTPERNLVPYRYDDSRYLLIDYEGDYSMIITLCE